MSFTVGTSQKYSTLSIAMHWLMALLIIGVYACIEIREFYPKGSDPREALKMWRTSCFGPRWSPAGNSLAPAA